MRVKIVVFGTQKLAKETTWRMECEKFFRKIEAKAMLTAEYLLSVAAQTSPDTRTRVRFCMVIGQLAKFADIDMDLQGCATRVICRMMR